MASLARPVGLPPGNSPGRFLCGMLVGVFLVCGVTRIAAQDRVVLIERAVRVGSSFIPGVILDYEVTERGRRWSLVRRVDLPRLDNGRPVAFEELDSWQAVPLADGSRLLWLARGETSSVLQQYDVATGRISAVDVGPFDPRAFPVADRLVNRVFVVDQAKVTIIDTRIRSIPLWGPKGIVAAYAADGYLVAQRRSSTDADDDEVVVINSETAEVVRVIPLGKLSQVRVSRDGVRLYRAYWTSAPLYENRLELISLTTGEVLARAVGPTPGWVFELHEPSGILIYSQSQTFVLRDGHTLALIAEFAPDFWRSGADFKLRQTPREGAILMYSRGYGNYFDCEQYGPRIDVFDGATLRLVNQLGLSRCLETIVPLPAR